MDWTVCSRETERDYTWDNAHAASSLASFARDTLAPAFEGSFTMGRFAAFLRCPGSPSGVVLGVSVSTARKDLSHCPIRTMAVLRAETPEETALLAAFFAECLRKPDKETLYDADSPLAKAVESLYQTKELDGFIAFCKALPKPDETSTKIDCRVNYPRDAMSVRDEVAASLPPLLRGDSPFLLALTDRMPADVLGSLGALSECPIVRIFSKAAAHSEKLPEPASQKYIRAAAIGGAVIFALLVAAIGSCSRSDGKGEAGRATNAVVRPSGGGALLGNGGTNGAPSNGVAETNAPTGRRGGGTNDPPSRLAPGGSVPATATNVPPKTAVTTNTPQASNRQHLDTK